AATRQGSDGPVEVWTAPNSSRRDRGERSLRRGIFSVCDRPQKAPGTATRVMWVGVFPALSQAGGVQQVGRHVGAVLVKRARERDLPCELLGLNDASGTSSFRVGAREYGFTGFERSKISLLLFLFRRMWRIETLWLGHVNLAPIGLLLKLFRPRLQYCVVAHGVEVWEPLPLFRRLALQHAQKVIAVSAYTAGAMVKAQK